MSFSPFQKNILLLLAFVSFSVWGYGGGGSCSVPRCGEARGTCDIGSSQIAQSSTERVTWLCTNTCSSTECSANELSSISGIPGGTVTVLIAPGINITGNPGGTVISIAVTPPDDTEKNPSNDEVPVPPAKKPSPTPAITPPLLPPAPEVSPEQDHTVVLGFYEDANSNHQFDTGEGFADVDVRVVRVVNGYPDTVVLRTKTDSTGYIVTRLPEGEYMAQIVDIPPGYSIAADNTWSFITDQDYASLIPVSSQPEIIDILPAAPEEPTSPVFIPLPDEGNALTSRVLDVTLPGFTARMMGFVKNFLLYAWLLLALLFLIMLFMMYKKRWMRYIVQMDDTIENLCFKFTMTQRAFLSKNHPVRRNGLHIGEKVWVKNRPFLQKSYWNQLEEVWSDASARVPHLGKIMQKFAKHP